VIASALCGMAPSIEFLIGARVLQGAVAGPMIPLSQSLLLSSYPKSKAGLAFAAWSMTTLVAPVIGPILGGWVSDNYSWPWIFLLNIPVGLLSAYAIWLLYRKRETATRKLPIDGIGLALLIVWVGALQVMLDKGKELDWFNSSAIVGLGLTAVVGLVFFLIWELTEKHPVVDLTLFKVRNFWAGVIAFSLAYGTFFGNLVILPLWLQTQLGYTATDAGLILAPVGLLAILLTPIVGKNLGRWDPRWLVTVGFALFAFVFYLRSGYTAGVDTRALLVPTIIQGIPMALFFVPLTAILLSGLPPERVPAAAGLANFCRMLCGGFGSSLATTLWDQRSSLHHAHLTEASSIYNPAFEQQMQRLGQLGLSPDQAHALFERQVSVQAGVLGVNDMFWISAALFLVLIGFVWLSRPVRAAAPMDAGGAH
jgi:DHA2 family multidrug resistance protein